jgi:hypothetical protein
MIARPPREPQAQKCRHCTAPQLGHRGAPLLSTKHQFDRVASAIVDLFAALEDELAYMRGLIVEMAIEVQS